MPEPAHSDLNNLLRELQAALFQGRTGENVTDLAGRIIGATMIPRRTKAENAAKAWGHLALALCDMWSRKGLVSALNSAREACASAEGADPLLYAAAIALLADLLRRVGDLTGAELQIRQLRRLGDNHGPIIGWAALAEGRLKLTDGKLPEAHGHFTEAVEELKDGPDATTYTLALCHVIFTGAAMAMAEGAERALCELAELLGTGVEHPVITDCFRAFVGADEPIGDDEHLEKYVIYAHGLADTVVFYPIVQI
jgi:tetratricopeptide (TPR) repeat protein